MKQASFMLRGAALAAVLCAASVPALAQQSQWTKGDKTQQQRTAILKKEINAAYAEQQSVCKRQSSGKRSNCLQSARTTYQRDLANVPRLVANAPQSTVQERVVAVTPAAPAPAAAPATPAPGSTAYGSSSAGSTSSSGDANASAAAASGSAPASTGAAPGTPHSNVTGEDGHSGAMMPEPSKPMTPQSGAMPDSTPVEQK